MEHATPLSPVHVVSRAARRSPARSRAGLAARTLAAGALATLASAPASAALREYRMQFQPSPTAGVTGYTMHLGTSAGTYQTQFDLGLPPAAGGSILYALDLEDSVDLYVVLRAYGSGNVVSSYSNEVHLQPIVSTGGGTGGTGGGTTDGGTGGSTGGSTGGTTDGGTGGGTGGSTGGGTMPGTLDPSIALGISTGASAVISQLLPSGMSAPLTMDSLASKGTVRPSSCDLEGDGDQDLVVGFGSGSGGSVIVLELEGGEVVHVETITSGTPSYRETAGRTTPACGDLDGDGRAEIVVGFSGSMRGVVQVFDDLSTGFTPMATARSNAAGFMQIPVPSKFQGSIFPAIGEIDGDDGEELVLGMSQIKYGLIVVLDDAMEGFAIHPAVLRMGRPWIQVEPSATSLMSGGVTVPALGDVDGDGLDEMAIGFGRGSRGRVALLDDAVAGYPTSREGTLILTTGRSSYQKAEGAARAAFGDVDGDGVEELVVGFLGDADHEVQVFDDVSRQLRPIGSNGGFVASVDRTATIYPAPAE